MQFTKFKTEVTQRKLAALIVVKKPDMQMFSTITENTMNNKT